MRKESISDHDFQNKPGFDLELSPLLEHVLVNLSTEYVWLPLCHHLP